MKIILYPILIVMLMVSCKSTKMTAQTKLNKFYKVTITQNGKLVESQDNIVNLNKSPFKIKLEYYKTEHVFVSCSWDKYYYDFPIEDNIFKCDDDRFLKIVDLFPLKLEMRINLMRARIFM